MARTLQPPKTIPSEILHWSTSSKIHGNSEHPALPDMKSKLEHITRDCYGAKTVNTSNGRILWLSSVEGTRVATGLKTLPFSVTWSKLELMTSSWREQSLHSLESLR